MGAAPGPSSVLLAGGGSAGHVSPLLALADALRRRNPEVGRDGSRDRDRVGGAARPGARVRASLRPPGPVAPASRPGAAAAARRPPRAVAAARQAIDETGAEVVVGFGGYVSTPAYLAARQRRIPIVVHEQNARAGLANRVGARMTPFVATTFRGTVLPHASVIGMPLRREVSQLDRAARRDEGMTAFGLDPQWPTILVTGGSLGAQRLNASFAARAAELSAAGLQVLHVTGAGKEFEPERPDVGAPYVVVPYADRMELAYAAADLVVCRSGANTVCELTAVGLPAVYVPLPIGNGEQRFNAADVLAAGGGLLVEDAVFTPEWITDNVVPLAGDGERLLAMGPAAASVGQRDADDALADMVHRAYASRPAPRADAVGGEGGRHDPAADPVRLPRRRPRGRGPGSGALRRDRRRRDVRGRADPAGQGRAGERFRRPESTLLHALAAEGASVHVGHDAALVDDADTVVISSAIRDNNPELRAAHTKGLPVLHRAQALAATMGGSRRVAVAGANGKTTTTSLLTVALQACGVDPSFAVGGELAKHGTNAHLGTGDVFVVEADESDGSFLVYRPEVAIVTSVQADHLDFYGDLATVEEAYRAFVGTIVPGGLLVACADDQGAKRARGRRALAGDPGADLRRVARRRRAPVR